MHLPQKDETGGPNALGLRVRQDIESAGGKLYDGFKSCGLSVADYQAHTRDPNERGYDKIVRCVRKIADRMTPK